MSERPEGSSPFPYRYHTADGTIIEYGDDLRGEVRVLVSTVYSDWGWMAALPGELVRDFLKAVESKRVGDVNRLRARIRELEGEPDAR